MWYRTGTIAATKSSKIVTGTGTKWADAKQGVGPGQMLLLPAAGTVVMYEIASVQSNTQLTLVDAFTGTTVTAQAYAIVTTYIDSVPDFARRLASQLSDYQSQLDGWQSILTGTGDVTLTAPDGTSVSVPTMNKMKGDYLSTTKSTAQNVAGPVTFAKAITVPNSKGVITGSTTVSGETSSAQFSGESGYAMIWRTTDSATKASEFVGVDRNSQVIFRRDSGKGDKTTIDETLPYYSQLDSAQWMIGNNVNVANWVKIASITALAQGGVTMRFEVNGGAGYNGIAGQNGWATLILRTGNATNTVVNTLNRAHLSVTRFGKSAVIDAGIIETTANSYDLYVKLDPYSFNIYVTQSARQLQSLWKNVITLSETQTTAPTFALLTAIHNALIDTQPVNGHFTFNNDVMARLFNGAGIKASGLGSGFIPTSQGSYMSWGYEAGTGRTDFICHKGNGSGGFGYFIVNNLGEINKLAALSPDGRINLNGNSSGILMNDANADELALAYTEPSGRMNLRVGKKSYTHIFTETGIIAAHIGLQPGRVALSYTDIQSGTIPNTGTASYIIRGADGANYNELCNMNFVSWYGVGFVPNVSTSLASGVTHGKPCVFVNTRTGYVEAINGFRHNGSVVYSTRNTTVDTNGYIKPASPIIKLFGNGVIENNESAVGTIAERVDRGIYRLSGMLGFNADALWGGNDGGISIPEDKNKQPLIWVDYDVEASGDILIKTYHRTHPDAPAFARNVKEGYENGDPIDIPDGRWIDLRIYMPVNDVEEVTDVDETPPESAI
ncbi:hypothetical protein [Edaphovirga cremea]|uniref:phage tail fiber protein n=1 Tax=Edaphovirga cremea TaxID=2267246 RepID=UPI003988DB8B